MDERSSSGRKTRPRRTRTAERPPDHADLPTEATSDATKTAVDAPAPVDEAGGTAAAAPIDHAGGTALPAPPSADQTTPSGVPPEPEVPARRAAGPGARLLYDAKGRVAVWRVAAVLVGVAALVVAVIIGQSKKPSATEEQWVGHLGSLAVMVLIGFVLAVIHTWAVRQARRAAALARTDGDEQAGAKAAAEPVRGVLIGADNRLSTSKLSAFAWTWVLGWAILSLAITNVVMGDSSGWNAFNQEGLKDEYLVLLGGPFVALVAAKALVGNAVASGTTVKPEAEGEQTAGRRISQAFSDDNGQTDLVDTQYLIFGAITLLVFVALFISEAGDGLPEIPDLLVGIASVGTTTYVANKWTAADAPPHLDRVVPERASPGDTITIYGQRLLTVARSGKRVPAKDKIEVLFDRVATQPVDPKDGHSSPSGNDYVKLEVPTPAASAVESGADTVETPLTVRDASGMLSDNTLGFTVVLKKS